MTTPTTTQRLPTPIVPATQRVKASAQTACERTIESLGLAALSCTNAYQRDGLLAAQFELNRKAVVFCQAFGQTLDERLMTELRLRDASVATAVTDWAALSLVDDHEVEVQVAGDRMGQTIGQGCEWELRELASYVGPLLSALGQRRQEAERNPLRPETIGIALVRAIESVSDRPEVRKALEGEFVRSFTAAMPQLYAGIASDLRSAGLKAETMGLRIAEPSGGDAGHRQGAPSGHGDLGGSRGHGGHAGQSGFGGAPSSPPGRAESQPRSARPTSAGGLGSTGRRGDGAPANARRGGSPMGQVDAELMALMRRLTTSDRGSTSGLAGLARDSAATPFEEVTEDGLRLAAPNIIRAHREELRQASAGAIDHMVIDVVGSLFDQILSDPKVPPQLARQIGRLQVPVLRTALGDPSFFSSRKHPVRRFINRIASLASAMEDLGDERGREFLQRVRELVQGVVDGDFDQAEVYEQQLAHLESFVAEQAKNDVAELGDPAALLAEREREIRVQQRYAEQLQGELRTLTAPEFVRDFLSAVWSQVLVAAARDGGADGERAQRLRRAGRELFMSVQTKGTAAQRKDFLVQLPQLMRALNEGMGLIGWPETAKQTFFGLLLPAHAQSLKGDGLRTLDFNLLARQVDQVFDKPLPAANDLPAVTDPGALDEAAIRPSFTTEEASRIGLVAESQVDWSVKVDIDLGGEAPVTEIDIAIDGLPLPEPVEPMRGKSLADHVQIGFAYQMQLQGEWQKVRLNHVSPGRTFFVFTHGARHKQTISLTHRMLDRLCESGRLRAFENAYLLERATSRARRQLASIRPA